MNRPLLPAITAYAAGLFLARYIPLPLIFLALVFVLVLVLGIVVKKFRLPFICLALAVLAWANYQFRTAPSAHDLRLLLTDEPAAVTVRGVLAATPRQKIIERHEQESWRSVARVRVSQIQYRGADFQPASGEILVTAPELLDAQFFAGQPVEISGVIARPPLPLAPGLFDFREYLATRGIYFQLRTDFSGDWTLLEPHATTSPLTDRFLKWSQRTLAIGLPVEDQPLRLLWAMSLGWRTAFTGDIDEPFLQAGTMHMFAIDGLRIALLSGMIMAVLRVFRLSRAWCGFIAIPGIWFYTAATGWESPAVRASVMMTIVLGGWALKRPVDLLNSLAAAGLVILTYDPRQLFEASFQLSFCVMVVIAVMLPPLNKWTDHKVIQWLGPDPLLAPGLVPAWRTWLVTWSQRFARFCGLSFAAWIGSLPLSAKYFNLFSPVSTLANLAAVPLGALALVANLAALMCGTWFAWLTDVFNHAAWGFMVAMTWVSEKSAALPGACFYVPDPGWPAVIVMYAAVIVPLSGWLNTARRKIAWASFLVIFGAIYFARWEMSRAETTVTVLPLNGGHAVHVDADGRRNDWLINCGNETAAKSTLKDFLHAQGVNTLPHLVLAEASARNCGGAKIVDAVFHPRELWTSSIKFRSPAYHDAIAAFTNNGGTPSNGQLQPVGRSQGPQHKIFNLGDTNGCWQVLFPMPSPANIVPKADDAPLVLLGTICNTRILLLSDSSRTAQNELLAQTHHDLAADIVIAGLPDDTEPLCDALIAAIHPQLIVIADSEYPASRRASRSLKNRFDRTKIPTLYTRSVGGVQMVFAPSGWKLLPKEGQLPSSPLPLEN